MNNIKNMVDFVGFSYGGFHSSDLGLLVVSEGSRYNRDLLPSQSENTISVPGRDGAYFVDSKFQPGTINLSLAYDNLEEWQMRAIRNLFGDKKPKEFIRDEEPYKVYLAKVTGRPTLSFICFDIDGRRIYKGEGRVTLTHYSPYAYSKYKFLQEYRAEMPEFNNVDEWAWTSRLLEVPDNLDKYYDGEIELYNAGDIATDYNLTFEKNSDIVKIGLSLGEASFSIDLNEAPPTPVGSRCVIKIDSEKKLLIQQIDDEAEVCINNCQRDGSIFKIPLNYSVLEFFEIVNNERNKLTTQIRNVLIDYRYYYL